MALNWSSGYYYYYYYFIFFWTFDAVIFGSGWLLVLYFFRIQIVQILTQKLRHGNLVSDFLFLKIIRFDLHRFINCYCVKIYNKLAEEFFSSELKKKVFVALIMGKQSFTNNLNKDNKFAMHYRTKTIFV